MTNRTNHARRRKELFCHTTLRLVQDDFFRPRGLCMESALRPGQLASALDCLPRVPLEDVYLANGSRVRLAYPTLPQSTVLPFRASGFSS